MINLRLTLYGGSRSPVREIKEKMKGTELGGLSRDGLHVQFASIPLIARRRGYDYRGARDTLAEEIVENAPFDRGGPMTPTVADRIQSISNSRPKNSRTIDRSENRDTVTFRSQFSSHDRDHFRDLSSFGHS